MATAHKFTFGASFDAPQTAKKPQPSFTLDDLDAAKRTAYLEGETAGRQAALASIAQVTEQTAQNLHQQIAALLEQEDTRRDLMKSEAATLAHAIATKLASHALKAMPLEEISAMVSDCIAHNPSEQRIVLRVADEQVDPLTVIINTITDAQGFAGKIVILGDPRLFGSDCLVEWADGGAERNERKIQQDIERIVRHYVASRQHAAEQQMPLTAEQTDGQH